MVRKRVARYTKKFKRNAVAMSLESGLSHAQLASQLGISPSTLGRWVKQYAQDVQPVQGRGQTVSDASARQDRFHLLAVDSDGTVHKLEKILLNEGHELRVHNLSDHGLARYVDRDRPWISSARVLELSRQGLCRVLGLVRRSGRDLPMVLLLPGGTSHESWGDAAGLYDCAAVSDPAGLHYALEREHEFSVTRNRLALLQARHDQLINQCYAVFDRTDTPIAVIGREGHVYGNAVYLNVLGYAAIGDIRNRPFSHCVAAEQRSSIEHLLARFADMDGDSCVEVEFDCLHSNGGSNAVRAEFRRFAGRDGDMLLVLRPSGEVNWSTALSSWVGRDPLTGMHSRAAFLDAARDIAAVSRETGARMALMYIKIDKFDLVQETVGYRNSDDVIQQLAKLITRVTADLGVTARFSAEAFTTLIESRPGVDPEAVAESVRSAVSAHVFRAGAQTLVLSCSIGVCRIMTHESDAEEAISRAAQACAVAEREGGGVHMYDGHEDIRTEEEQRVWVDRVLAALRDNGHFSMVYQPIVNLHGGNAEYYEAFLRMNSQTGTSFMPGDFLPAAESAGLMKVVDQWVIKHAVSVLWKQESSGKELSIFIKLSRDTVTDDGFVEWLDRLLKEQHFNAARLVFELAEIDVTTHLAQSQRLISGVKDLGCRVLVDHFGSGLNSFSLLQHVDVDFLKIDGSLVNNLAAETANQVTVKSISEMANSLGKETIAESVQDAASLAVLWQCGVHYIQGYFLREPSHRLDYDFSASM